LQNRIDALNRRKSRLNRGKFFGKLANRIKQAL
jgi:hypothetical protein